MTCIVGVAVDGQAFIGADSCATVDDGLFLIENGKIFSRGEFIMGSAGTRRTSELFRYRMKLPKVPKGISTSGLDRFMATLFADAMLRVCRENGAISQDEDGQVETFSGSVIIGVRGRIYFADASFSVTPVLDGVWSTGSGSDFALGSLRTSRRWKNVRERIEAALEAAAFYTNGVRPPFHVLPKC